MSERRIDVDHVFRARARLVALGLLMLCSACAGAPLVRDTSALHDRGLEGLDDRLRAEPIAPNGVVDHYAVLIGANTELRHRGNLSMAYQVLIEQGYEREKVFILESEGDATFMPTTDFTTRLNLERLFAHLKTVVEADDTLLIYVTGHGRRVQATEEERGLAQTVGVSTILLNKTEELSDWEFASLLEGLEPAMGIAFFDQCYGAIFATTSRSCNFVFITAAREDETSYGVAFPRAFWNAFRGRDARTNSVLDAYLTATREDRGTILGYNSPRISHRCIDPARVSLLGEARTPRPVLSANVAANAAHAPAPRAGP